MRKTLLLLLSMLSCTIALAQTKAVEGCVIDDATGERLPYVRIECQESSKVAMANSEGEFALQADASEMLCFSFVGYEKCSVKASELTDSVRLKPWDNTLGELTVMPGDVLLMKVNKLLKKEHAKYKKEEAQYFMRMITYYDEEQELTEAFMTARSMGHLREPRVVKGRYGHSNRQEEGQLDDISAMNFHHIMEVGPWLRQSKFWDSTITPLQQYQTKATLRDHYDVTVQTLRDSAGKQYYLFRIKRTKSMEESSIVFGKLYVDATTFQPLRFDGLVETLMLEVGHAKGISSSAINVMHINMGFDHSKGYTEVASMACDMYSRGLGFRALGILLKVDDIDLGTTSTDDPTKKSASKGKRLNDNLLSTINTAGYDDQLWERTNIIKRTADETKALGINTDNVYSGDAYQVHAIKWLRITHFKSSLLHNTWKQVGENSAKFIMLK